MNGYVATPKEHNALMASTLIVYCLTTLSTYMCSYIVDCLIQKYMQSMFCCRIVRTLKLVISTVIHDLILLC